MFMNRYVTPRDMSLETHLSDADIDRVLKENETGVLALARENHPYATPVSYGYDSEKRRLYLRFVAPAKSDKGRLLDSATEATLVVYASDGTWVSSVIARGQLEIIGPEELTEEEIINFGKAQKPRFDMWQEQLSELDIQLIRIEPTKLTGRRLPVEMGQIGSTSE